MEMEIKWKMQIMQYNALFKQNKLVTELAVKKESCK